MLKPTFAKYIASFLQDAKDNLNKIDRSNVNTYMQYARYVIIFLFSAVEMLFKDIARDRINSGTIKLKTPNSKPQFDHFTQKIWKRDMKELITRITTKDLKIYFLLQLFKYGTQPDYFGLTSISSVNEIQTLDDLRETRNLLIHQATLDPNKIDTLENAFPIVVKVFREIFQSNYSIIEYKAQIEKIPDKDPYKPIRKIYQEILVEMESPTREDWKIYCYAKFILCYMFNEVYKIYKLGSAGTLLYFFQEFANIEHEFARPNGYIMLADRFRAVHLMDLYKLLTEIVENIDPDQKNLERILDWFKLDSIREVIKNTLSKSGRHSQEDLDDINYVKQIAYNNTQLGAIINHGFKRESWLTKFGLQITSPEEEKYDLLNNLIENFQKEITSDVAEEMLSLSLRLCKFYIENFDNV